MKSFPLIVAGIGLASAMVAACSHNSTEHLSSLNAEYIDSTIAPGTDFYSHVNKKWMEANPLTPEHARYGRFNVLGDTSEARVRSLVEGLGATNPQPGTVAYKVWTVYSQAMDTARRNAEGAKPILADLKRIEDTPAEGMDSLFMWMHGNYASPFFGAGPMEDFNNSEIYAMYVFGGGMGLGDRDYYLKNDERNTAVRNAYKTLIASQMKNAGYSEADAARIVANVMKIETALADSALTREESRDLVRMNNRRSISEVKAAYPAIQWDTFFPQTMGIATPDSVIVTELAAVNQANSLMASLSDREKKDYYLWKYVSQASSELSDDFTLANFEFSKVMSGVQ
ncbi:MAG: M13 family metallopeptidase, partial [Duncaniella sp.]|nr:M13 family metallopeptidase [Duncaniella sp.]